MCTELPDSFFRMKGYAGAGPGLIQGDRVAVEPLSNLPVKPPENHRKTGGKPENLENRASNRWKTVGKTAGKPASNRWKTAGKTVGKTAGKPAWNRRETTGKTVGKPAGNRRETTGKTVGKPLGNRRETTGKTVGKPVGKPPGDHW